MNAVVVGAGFAVLLVLSVVDIRTRTIPNRIVLPAAAVLLALHCAVEPSRAFEWTVAALGTFALLLVAHLVYPAGLGMGDVKLGLLLGALLGGRTPLALLVASLALGLGGLILLAVRGGSARRLALPFAPFVAAGAVVALLAVPLSAGL